VLISALAIFEDHDGGDTANAVLLGGQRRIVDVEFPHFGLVPERVGDLVDDRGECATGSTPSGREIHKDGLVGAQHLFGKVDVIENLDLVRRHSEANIMRLRRAASVDRAQSVPMIQPAA
jgi:hypothetical protein